MTKRLAFLVVAGLLVSSSGFAQTPSCPDLRGRPFFVNGIDNSRRKATDSKDVLQNELEVALGRGCIQVELAYNQNEPYFLDIYEAAEQLKIDNPTFWLLWNFLAPVNIPFSDLIFQTMLDLVQGSYVNNENLEEHLKAYRTLINQGLKVVLVGHSQGNLYANAGYRVLKEELGARVDSKIAVISVATPASFVEGNGPYTTLEEDRIHEVTGALSANITNGFLCFDFFGCHNFIRSYLFGPASGPRIISQIINAIPTVVQPPTGITQITNIPSGTPLRLAGINSNGSRVALRLGNLDSTGGSQLWSVNSDGSNLTQITPDSLNVASAFFSGTKGVFIACETPCGTPGNVYTLNYDGTELTKLTDDGNGSSINYGIIGISSDGTRVVYLKSFIRAGFFESALFIFNTDNTNVRQLIVPPNSTTSNSQFNQAFTLNSDGSRLAFAYRDNGQLKIALLNTSDNVFQDIVDIGSLTTLTPVFALSSDGSTLVYGADTVFGTTVGLAAVKTDGTGQMLLDQIPFADPTISFDGTEICYSGLVGSQHTDILCIRSDGTNRRNISNTPAGAFAQPPFLSENGAAVAFVSNADLDPGKNTDLSGEIFVAGLR